MNLNLTRLARYAAPWRMGLFVLCLLLLWAPLAWAVTEAVSDRNTQSLITMPLLYLEFIGLVQVWGRSVYQQPNLLKHYGLKQSRWFLPELILGFAIGAASLLVMFGLQGGLGWLVWQAPQPDFFRILSEGLVVALAFGFAEELLFRGWLLDELQRDYKPPTALWVSSLIYALLHCLRPLRETLQFPALVALGLALVWAKRASQNRLGLSMGLHAGFVWSYYLINVGKLTQPTNQVPDWVTGVERNPLAGILGLVSLSAIALGMRWWAQWRGGDR